VASYFNVDDYKSGDEKYLARIHKESLSVGLLSELPSSTLSIYFSRLAKQDGTKFLIVRNSEHEVMGFCVIQIGNQWLFPFLSIRIICGVFRSILKKPSFLRIILNRIFSENLTGVGGAEISIICVSEIHRGSGIGNSLISAVVKWCDSNGIKSIYTTTHNERLAKFYVANYGGQILSTINLGSYQVKRILLG